MTQEEKNLHETIAFNCVRLSQVGIGIRVEKWVAKKWLLENRTIMSDGFVFYMQIKDLGLGVCEVSKAPIRVRSTRMVKLYDLK